MIPPRLHRRDGDPLDAPDLRREQSVHRELDRTLHAALLCPGVASGLDVDVAPGTTHAVSVSPGVAMDPAGREIVLAEARTVPAVGVPSPVPGVLQGNFLVIEYGEEQVGGGAGSCPAPDGPTLVRPHPRLRWTDRWPPRPGAAGSVVLAQVELDDGGAVRRVSTRARTAIRRRRRARLVPFTLCGAKDVGPDDVKELFFHVRDGRAERVVLRLWITRFPSLYYSELGGHAHEGTAVELADTVIPFGHTHRMSGASGPPRPEPTHQHGLRVEHGTNAKSITPSYSDVTDSTAGVVGQAGAHHHVFAGASTRVVVSEVGHTHAWGVREAPSGAAHSAPPRTGARHELPDQVLIRLGDADLTGDVVAQLGLPTMEPGLPVSSFSAEGTGEIDLSRIVPRLRETGEHRLSLSVAGGGGRLHYSLAVT